MERQELVAKLIEINDKQKQIEIIEKYSTLVSVELAEDVKNTYYESWTRVPAKTRNAANALEIIAEIIKNDEVDALVNWVNGIAAMTEGKATESVKFLDAAAQIFHLMGQDYRAAQAQVAKIYALAMLGRYDEASQIGKAILNIFVSYNDQLAAGKIEKNLGTLLFRRGYYSESLEYLTAAHARFLALNDEPELAMVENNLAVIKTHQNDFRAAETLYQQALKRSIRTKLQATEAEIESSLGNLALFRGHYNDALKYLEKSRRKYAELQMPHYAATTELEIANVYLELNLISEASKIYPRLISVFDNFNSQAEVAQARMQFGKTLAKLGHNDDAFDQLNLALGLYQNEKNYVGAAIVMLLEAFLLLQEGDFNSANYLASETEKKFVENGRPRERLLAAFVRGESERRMKNFSLSKAILHETLAATERHEQIYIACLCETALGQTAVAENDLIAAEQYFLQSTEKVQNLRQMLQSDEFRTAFYTDKLLPFYELMNIYLQANDKIRAMKTIEQARSKALLDLIGDESLLLNEQDEAARKIESLREELNWFYSRLNRPTFGELREARREEIQNWQNEIRRCEQAINELVLQTQANGKSFLRESKDFDITALQHSLGDNRILLEFVELDGKFAAFVVEQNAIEFVENLGNTEKVVELIEQLHFQFGTLRYGAATLERHLPLLKRRTEKHLADLYEILLRPLERYFANRHLVVVPSGVLHYVPFHALYDGEKFLVERSEVSAAPSAAVLQHLCGRQSSGFGRILAVGYADERAPQVENEVLSLLEIEPETRVLIGESATFAAVRECLRNRFDVLHLACHGHFRAENPLFSSLHLADGLATVRDVARLKLNNALVVLSACETGMNKIAAGDELLGLVRGFLTAGANSLLLSLWTVNDETAAVLMREFYRHLKIENSPAAALRAAQLKFIENESHPYFWSPFMLVGKW